MLIDDNEIDLFLEAEFIRMRGIADDLISFRSAQEGLQHLMETNPDQWPDLVLLDVEMPVMNGFEFLNQFSSIKSNEAYRPAIVMISSTLDYGDIAMARANNMVLDILSKPLKIAELVVLLESNELL